MAYESLLSDIEEIERRLAERESIRDIAEAIGRPEARALIGKYKKEVFDFNNVATIEWTEEKQKGHEERFNAGKERIINNYEFLNKMKIKADELLNWKVGDEYKTAEQTRIMTPGSLAKIHGEAVKMGISAIHQESELASDDPQSRTADAVQSLSEVELDAKLIALIEKREDPTN